MSDNILRRAEQTPAALFAMHATALERKVAARITTSRENVQDACAFAWQQLLTHDVGADYALGWLIVVATREALRLDRRWRAVAPLPVGEDGGERELPSPVDEIASRERWIDSAATLHTAGLSDRQRRMVALQAAGHSYQSIAQQTAATPLTVQRQLLRAHKRIRHAREGGENPRATAFGEQR